MYIGVSILDLSKLHMYEYYYDVMKKIYDAKVNLLYTDTYSCIFHIELMTYTTIPNIWMHIWISVVMINHTLATIP